MQCDPYEPRSIRSERLWREAAATMDTHPAVLMGVYLDQYCVGIDVNDFFSIIKRKRDDKFTHGVEKACAAYPKKDLDAKFAQSIEQWVSDDFSDLMGYRLKQLIQVGDEWVSSDTKTYTFSDIQYLTKGKRYTITELEDRIGSNFSFKHTTDLPGETSWDSNYGVQSLWRNGVEIWNWWKAYLDLWLEQNPNDPQTNIMSAYMNQKIAEYVEAA